LDIIITIQYMGRSNHYAQKSANWISKVSSGIIAS